MKIKSAYALLALCVLVLSGCSKPQPVLHLYNWVDYVKPELMTQFEKEDNCKVVLDTCDSNEALCAKLKMGASVEGGSGFDHPRRTGLPTALLPRRSRA